MMSPANADLIRSLALQPNVNGLDVYADGVEVTGTPDDSDGLAGFVVGSFDPADVAAAVEHRLPVEDCRGETGLTPHGVPS